MTEEHDPNKTSYAAAPPERTVNAFREDRTVTAHKDVIISVPVARIRSAHGTSTVKVRAAGFSAEVRRPKPNPVTRPPGRFLLALGKGVFTKKFHEGVLLRILADMRYEYYEALLEKRRVKAEWLRVCFTYRYFSHIVQQVPLSLLSALFKIWRQSGS